MIINEKLKKVLPFVILLSVGFVLVSFLHLNHKLTETVLSNQWHIYRLSTMYYRNQAIEHSEPLRGIYAREFKKLIHTTTERPFFKKIRIVDPDINAALSTLEAESESLSRNFSEVNKQSMEKSLSLLQQNVDTHIDKQLSAIQISNNATGLALIILVGLALYLYHRNDLYLRQLQQAVEEKEYLIKEVHHRVKNNLAMIHSFLNLQAYKIENDSVVQDLKNQIRAVSTVHEKLYNDDNVTAIHFPRYVRELVSEIFYSLSRSPVSLHIDMDDIYIDPDRAVPLGLILSELATNAVKHAFEQYNENSFTVKLSEEKQKYTLTVKNSGRPFPEDVNLNTVSSLGLVLINNLVQQLHGSLSLKKNPHTCFTITFPV